MAGGKLELRCTCRRKPLLAVAGRDERTAEAFIHIRTIKNKEIHTDVVITSGSVRIHCRECLHWQTFTIRRTKVDVQAEELPSSVVI